MGTSPLNVQCVYGNSHLHHLQDVLIPALKRTTARPVRLLATNYDPHSRETLISGYVDGVEVLDVPNRSAKTSGFGENHNRLFASHPGEHFFVIVNPDCIPQAGSIDALISRKTAHKGAEEVAIVEGRQWPFEHPKEYDRLSLKTPWASGAFSLIDAAFYKRVGGMDEIYFLYLEDVDLSWQAWLNGYSVLYEPAASIFHFSGGPFLRRDLVSSEQYLSLRNFLIISRKFFGESGERTALSLLKKAPESDLAESAIAEYFRDYRDRIATTYWGRRNRNVKILGLNQFHECRKA